MIDGIITLIELVDQFNFKNKLNNVILINKSMLV